jgi:hypothetical protein
VAAPATSSPQSDQSKDNTQPLERSLRIRLGKHTVPLLILGAFLAVYISAGGIGIALIILVGIPIASYSIYKDLEEQKGRVSSSPPNRVPGSMPPMVEAPVKTDHRKSSSQETIEPPRFDYSPRNGKLPNTDEWGIANTQIILQYACDSVLYGLALRVAQHRMGKGTRSVDVEVIWGAVLLMAAEEDKEMANLLMMPETREFFKSMVIAKLEEEGLCLKLANGEIEAAEGFPESVDPTLGSDDYADVEIEGLVFPKLTSLSPDEIHHYASHQKEWIAKYPGGAENWPQLVVHSRLLKQNRVEAYQSEAGPWLYTATASHDKPPEQQPVQQPSASPAATQARSRTLSEEDQMMLAMWEMVRPQEAVDLKFIVMDQERRFAGEFIANDQHGDRYFTLTENSKGGWQMGSNLVGNDPAMLSKSARKRLETYRDIISKMIYRYENDRASNSTTTDGKNNVSEGRSSSSSGGRLTGKELITRLKQLGDLPSGSRARLRLYQKGRWHRYRRCRRVLQCTL